MKSKYFAMILTIVVIGLFVFAGPIDALVLNLGAVNTDIVVGNFVNFFAGIKVNPGENINVDYLILNLDGPENVSCKFLSDGTKLSTCKGINIQNIEDESDDPGYGYSIGRNLSYNITLDSDQYDIGEYKTKLFLYSGSQKFSVNGPIINILEDSSSHLLSVCSVRARDGLGTSGNTTFNNLNRLNFNVPKTGAANGKGSLTGQIKRDRLSYNFNIIKVLSNNANTATIQVRGEMKLNRNPVKNITSTLVLDKKGQMIDVQGNNFNFKDMNVTLMRGCI